MTPEAPERPDLALLTDLYQLTMAGSFVAEGLQQRRAVYHLTFRNGPSGSAFCVVCGLHPLLDAIESLRFDAEALDYLQGLKAQGGRPLFADTFLEWLHDFRFGGDLWAMPEGTVSFPGEPVLRVEGGVAECQLLETLVLNQLNYASAIATRASRVCYLAADGAPVLEFGLRRAPGIGGGLAASRAAWIGGCAATSNVLAGRRFGIPVRGTHAHSWVMAFDSERVAFDAYVRAMPHNAVLLVDTYDTRAGIESAIEVAQQMRRRGENLAGIRLDSGDLLELSRFARARLNEAGLDGVQVIASGGLDEHRIAALRERGAAVDVWGVGTRLVAGGSGIDGVYKMGLVEDGVGVLQPRRKFTEDPAKASLPGRLQVARKIGDDGQWSGDVIRRASEDPPAGGVDLLEPMIEAGKRLVREDDSTARERVADQVAQLPQVLRTLQEPAERYAVELSASLQALRDAVPDEGRAGTRRKAWK